jgi:hypothetical protein
MAMDDKHLLELAAKAAGGLDWEWWTSNSHRRLTFKQGQHTRDGSALLAFRNQADGWPDVSMAPGVQEFIERASPKAVLGLLDRIAELEAALRPFAALNKMLPPHDSLINPGFRPYISELGEAPFRVPDIRRAAAAMGENDAK